MAEPLKDQSLSVRLERQDSELPVWMVVEVIREHGGSVPNAARHFDRPAWQTQAAIEYAQAFPEEIESALAARNAVSPADLRRLLPGLTGGGDWYSTMPA